MSTENNTAKQPEVVDYFAWFKESIMFDLKELDEEIEFHVERLVGTPDGDLISAAATDQEENLKIKKAITEAAILFSGAYSIPEDKEWDKFSQKMLEQAATDGRAASLVRSHLILSTPNEAREAMEKMIDSDDVDAKIRRMLKMRFNIRLDAHLDTYRKQLGA